MANFDKLSVGEQQQLIMMKEHQMGPMGGPCGPNGGSCCQPGQGKPQVRRVVEPIRRKILIVSLVLSLKESNQTSFSIKIKDCILKSRVAALLFFL